MQDLSCEKTSMAVERRRGEWTLAKYRYKKVAP